MKHLFICIIGNFPIWGYTRSNHDGIYMQSTIHTLPFVPGCWTIRDVFLRQEDGSYKHADSSVTYSRG